jgi:undecaprenyl-diphosphatase
MQEEILRFFQEISNPLTDKAAELITMLGEQYFFILIISFLFWNISRKEGFKLVSAFIFSAVLNAVIKISFHTPRPFEKLDYITGKRVHTATGYSFPSGHTQGSAVFFITLSQIIRRRWFTIIAIILIFMVGLSRIYLGVHWPVDVIASIILGIIVSFIFCTLVDKYYDDTAWLQL